MNKSKNNYTVNKPHKFFTFSANIVEQEINPGVTVTFSSEVDLTQVDELRAKCSKELKPSYTAFVAKAMAIALQEYPYANRRIIRRPLFPLWGTRMQQFTTCDIAVACERNLEGIEVATFIDILRNAEELDLVQITKWLQNLAMAEEGTNQQWKSYKNAIFSMPVWLSSLIISRLPVGSARFWSKWRGGATIISSPARYGVDSLSGSWTHPLGVTFGKVRKKPLVHDGQVVIGTSFVFALNFDRRVMAGAQAARFFHRIVSILENASVELSRYLPVVSDKSLRGKVQPV